jgi:hypothetical protein
MRSASDIDRPPNGLTAYDNLFTDAGGFEPALLNLYAVGEPIIQGIIKKWDSEFKKGIKRKFHSLNALEHLSNSTTATNYIGDIFGSLGGTPDFGPGRSSELPSKKKRSVQRRERSMRMKRDPRFADALKEGME